MLPRERCRSLRYKPECETVCSGCSALFAGDPKEFHTKKLICDRTVELHFGAISYKSRQKILRFSLSSR